MNIKERKIELRKRMNKLRASLTPSERKAKTDDINRALLREVMRKLESGRTSGRKPTLFTYMPHKTEADITPVMEACWEQKYRVVISKSIPELRQMRLHEVFSYEDMEPGAWGIREPLDTQPLVRDIGEVDVVLVPGLAFDLAFGRLGYGGGYYDRYMQRYVRANRPKPYLIAAAFELQIVPEVPLGLFDFRVHHIVTEARSVTAPASNGDGSENQ